MEKSKERIPDHKVPDVINEITRFIRGIPGHDDHTARHSAGTGKVASVRALVSSSGNLLCINYLLQIPP